MGFWQIAKIVGGVFSILYGLSGFLTNGYSPMGWTTKLIWREKNIPVWTGCPFYVLFGLILLYWGFAH